MRINLKCPICREQPLERCQYEGLMLWRCATCKGILLDDAKIRRIENQFRKSPSELEFAAAIGESDTVDAIDCPRCRIRMDKQSGLKQRAAGYRSESVAEFLVDHCRYCESTWFDGGELAKLQLSYERSLKGRENKRTYVNLDELSPSERAEYLRAIADSSRSSGDSFWDGFKEGIGEVLGRLHSGRLWG